MNASDKPYIHLVGSVPLADAEQVFRAVAGTLGPHLRRLPDGETGKRADWIRFIQAMLSSHPALEVDPDFAPLAWRQWDGVLLREIPRLRFRAGVDPDKVAFETGYAEAAVESFATFVKLQDSGAIPAGVKFQVCLPTPLAPGYNYISPRAQADFLRVFEAAMVREVARLADAIPHDRLAVQWDVCQEVLMWEGYYPERPAHYKEQILGQLARVGAAVPAGAELGYHLCYGSPRDEHLMQPSDMGAMVEMCRGLLDSADRKIDFLHLPVPHDRTDDEYFAPLKNLSLPKGCDLALGLVHVGEDAENRARLHRAQAVSEVAGVGSECGWGRKGAERLAALLDAHLRVIGA
jgi:hypothetical protein